ncbi:hypothetical protein AB0C04_10195 [Micromonospora sp. NPDC048909]|uniref:hypothetical protein n=1 Tax=Micromonospora sp. NPDC048909 TaxID=3155643 RepID=UPI0034038FE0
MPNPPTTSTPPTIDQTCFDWASLLLNATATLAAILALFLAVRAIRITRDQAARADAALIRERRATFELQVFRDLLDSIAAATPGDLFGLKLRDTLTARLAMLPADELPVWRAYANEYVNDRGKEHLAQALAKIGAVNDDPKRGYEPLFWALLEDIRQALERRGQTTAAVSMFGDPGTT